MSKIVWKSSAEVSPQLVSAGIYMRLLWTGDSGSQAMVVEIAPGAKWVGVDEHVDRSEEVFVVRGSFNDGQRDYTAGTFIHHPIGTSHVPQSETGCVLFIFYPTEPKR